jgi:hypothetical protein
MRRRFVLAVVVALTILAPAFVAEAATCTVARTFLGNHIGQVMAADFFVVPTAACRLPFGLVILRTLSVPSFAAEPVSSVAPYLLDVQR